MARTRKPCPACGEVCQFRPAAEVCRDCKGLLADGEKYRQLSEESGCEPYQIPQSTYNFPYIQHTSQSFGEGSFEKDFQRAIFDVLDAIAGPLPSNVPYTHEELFRSNSRGERKTTVMLQPQVVEPLRAMYQAVQGIAIHAFDEGKARGSNLLMQLASGDVGLSEFNEATLNRDEESQ